MPSTLDEYIAYFESNTRTIPPILEAHYKKFAELVKSQHISQEDYFKIARFYTRICGFGSSREQMVQVSKELDGFELSHSQIRVGDNCNFDRICCGLAVCGLAPPVSDFFWPRQKQITVPWTKKLKRLGTQYEQRRSGNIRFGKVELPFEIFSVIISFHGTGITSLAPLCLVNKDIAHVLGNSAIGILLCARHINWNVPECESGLVNAHTTFMSSNKNLQSLCATFPCQAMVTSILGLSNCTTLTVLKIKSHDPFHTMNSISGIEKLTNLHTLSISCKDASVKKSSNLDLIKLLTKLKHLDIVVSKTATPIPISLHMELESLVLETDCPIYTLPSSITKFKFVHRKHKTFSFDFPHLQSLELGGWIDQESLMEMLKQRCNVKHLALFTHNVLQLDLDLIPSSVISLETNQFVRNLCRRQFENLEYNLIPIDLGVNVTKSATFTINYEEMSEDMKKFKDLVRRLGHLRLRLFCSHFFDVQSIMKETGCESLEFNEMLVNKDQVVVREKSVSRLCKV